MNEIETKNKLFNRTEKTIMLTLIFATIVATIWFVVVNIWPTLIELQLKWFDGYYLKATILVSIICMCVIDLPIFLIYFKILRKFKPRK